MEKHCADKLGGARGSSIVCWSVHYSLTVILYTIVRKRCSKLYYLIMPALVLAEQLGAEGRGGLAGCACKASPTHMADKDFAFH